MSEVWKDLRNFDDTHLKLLNRMVYDHWTWDSGNPNEKTFLDAIEAELQERSMGIHGTPPYDSEFYLGTSYQQFDSSNGYEGVRIGAGQYNDELNIKAIGGIKLNCDDIITGTGQFGWKLEQEVRRMAQEEVRNMLTGESRITIKDIAEEAAKKEINTKIKNVLGVT